jgi:murein DD-endopeptidase MepM/ murein hydrolase activator NlpD
MNGKGVGDADFGNPIYSPVDGVVTYEKRTWSYNGGWGNVIVIQKD